MKVVSQDNIKEIVKRVKLSAGRNVSIDDNVINVDVDTSKLVTKDETKQFATKKDISFTSEANVGDVCFYDKTADKLIIKTFDGVKDDNLVPIGVVVIPSSHDVYGDGSAAVVSLKYMSAATPNEGTLDYKERVDGNLGVVWGNTENSIPLLTKQQLVPYFGTVANQTNELAINKSEGVLPSDSFSGPVSIFDPNARYHKNYLSYPAIPSPYLADGSRNSVYSSKNTTLSDFNGVNNTKAICNVFSYADWKKIDTFENIGGSTKGNYPAAACCWRYSTEGTNQGDWYLPACGELGYVVARSKVINETITSLKTAYGSTISSELYSNDYYWSSTANSYYDDLEDINKYACAISLSSGTVTYSSKSSGHNVRAFLRVHPTESTEFKKNIESIAEETINKTVDTSKLVTKEDAEKTYVPYNKNTEDEKSIKLEAGSKSIYVSDSKISRKTEEVESDNVVWHSELDGLIPDTSKNLSITSEYIEEATKDLSEDDKKDYTKLPPEIVLQKILDTVMVLDNTLDAESSKNSSDVMIEYEQANNIDYYTMLVNTDGDEEYYVNDCQYKLYTDDTKNVAKAIPGFLSGIKDKYNTVDFSVHGLKLNVEYTDDKAFVLKGTLDDDKFLMSVCTPTDGSEPLIAWKRTRLTDFTTKDKEKLDTLNSGCIYVTADTKENIDYKDPSNKIVSLIQSDYQEDKYIAVPVYTLGIQEIEDSTSAELKFVYDGEPSDLDSKRFVAYLYNEEDGSQFDYDIEPFCKQRTVRVDYSTRSREYVIAVDVRDLFPITNCAESPRQDFGAYSQQLTMKYKLILIPVYNNAGTPSKPLVGKVIIGENEENPETVKVLISGYDKNTYEDIDELHTKILSKINPTIL